MTLLKQIGAMARITNEAHGFIPPVQADWTDAYKIPAFLALIHSEVSEGLEAFRESDLAGLEGELADVIIRTLDLAHGLGLDMDTAVAAKMVANMGRPYQHGGKRL